MRPGLYSSQEAASILSLILFILQSVLSFVPNLHKTWKRDISGYFHKGNSNLVLRNLGFLGGYRDINQQCSYVTTLEWDHHE